MIIRRVAGGIIINEDKQIFLGESPKWQGWTIPAGGVEEGETVEGHFTLTGMGTEQFPELLKILLP